MSGSTGAFCLRVRDFEISYERIRWPAISRNQNNGGLRGEKFRVRVVICVVYLPCLKCRLCQNIEKRLGCLWRKVTAKYFRIIRGNQVVLVWNSCESCITRRALQTHISRLDRHFTALVFIPTYVFTSHCSLFCSVGHSCLKCVKISRISATL